MPAPFRVVVVDDGAGQAAAGARVLRDAGCEVIYAAPASTDELVELCLQEDVDAVWPEVSGLADALVARGLDDVVVAGGDPGALVDHLLG